MTLPPELVEFARTWFTAAGGADPSTWPARVELGLQATAIGAAVLAVITAAIALAKRRVA